jgi:hypothetical protein
MAAPVRIVLPNPLVGLSAIRLASRPQARQAQAQAPVICATSTQPLRPLTLRERQRDRGFSSRYFNPDSLLEVGQAAPPGKPPDENKVKLGRSKLVSLLLHWHAASLMADADLEVFCSTTSITGTLTKSPSITTPARDPRAKHLPPSLPLYTPTPTNSLRAGSLHSSPLDRPNSMEPPSHSRRPKAEDPLRANGQTAAPLRTK